jgi:regulatory protein
MKITTEQGKGGRLNIFADGEFIFSIESVVWYDYHIFDSDEVDEDTLDEIKSESVRRRCLNSALNILTGRAHSRRELSDKLRRKYDADACEYALNKAEDMGFIDDYDFATSYAKELNENKFFSPCRIKNELFAKGVDRNIITQVLDEIEIDIIGNIKKVIERKYPDCADDEKSMRRMIAGLQRLGYSYSDIKEAIGSER